MVKIGIVGGGFAGLGTAYYLKDILKDKKNEITILEHGDRVGGIASGFRTKEWDWSVDKVIHHWFTTDKWAFGIAKELGLQDKLIIKDTKSSCYYNGKIAELDSPISLLKFPFLNIFDRIRMGAVMALLRLDNNYLRYENSTSFSFLKKSMGKKAFDIVWKPLFLGKFGKYAYKINAAWFWARVNPRTKSLGYIEGGFQTYADEVLESIQKEGGKLILNAKISKIKKKDNKFEVNFGKKKMKFDVLVLAVPLPVAIKIYNFPESYMKKYAPLKSIGAQYFVLELKKSFLDDGSYWLNVNDASFPFMMVAEHTNFVDKKHYNNKHIIWVGKYLDYDDDLWKLSEKEFLDKIIQYLKKINKNFHESWIERSFFSRFRNAQPILPLGYSKKILPIETPTEDLYLANMNHIYPSDRGTNLALGLGNHISKLIKKKL